MTGLVLENFVNRIAQTMVTDISQQPTLINFNSNSAINASADCIAVTNSNNYIKNGDSFVYYTSTGNTASTGLANGYVYSVSQVNSTAIVLANSSGIVNLTKGLTESGHYLSKVVPSYYFAASKPTQWDNELQADTPYDNESISKRFKQELLFGKRIQPADVAYMIRKIQWQANTRFDQYDDLAEDLYNSNFYVLTTDNKVYKCLYNGGSNTYTLSGAEPTDTTANVFSTSDGYKWKYMYTLSTANNNKFSTQDYIPVDANSSIIAASVNGSIEVIYTNDTGLGYITTTSGTVQETVTDSIYKIETATSSTQNNFYTTSAFYITGGSGEGQITPISSYVTNGSGHFVITQSTLTDVDQTSTYLISPQIKITGDGTGALAYCTVNNAVNSYFIDSVTVINKGQNYSYANVEVVANTSYGSNASMRAIISPDGGHGANPYAELGSKYICISTTFSNNESNTITTNTTFRQAGIMYDPKTYSNNSLSYTGTTFRAVTQMFVTTGVTSFSDTETINGLTSNAVGILINSTPTYIEVAMISGHFANGETIQGSTSSATATISDGSPRLFTLTNNSNTALCTGTLSTSNTSGIVVGQRVTGIGILPNTVVTGIVSDTSISLSIGATTTGDQALSFIPINNPDIDKYTSKLLFVNNFESVTRSNTSTENVKLLINV